MTIAEKLRYLELSKDFNVVESNSMVNGKGKYLKEYNITFTDLGIDLCATVVLEDYKLKEVKYYVSGVYNSCCDYANIDMEKLSILKDFVELLVAGE